MAECDYVNPCVFCSCWDSDTEACTMPSVDRQYACSLFSDDLNYDEFVHFMEDNRDKLL